MKKPKPKFERFILKSSIVDVVRVKGKKEQPKLILWPDRYGRTPSDGSVGYIKDVNDRNVEFRRHVFKGQAIIYYPNGHTMPVNEAVLFEKFINIKNLKEKTKIDYSRGRMVVDTRAYAPDLDQVAMQAHEIQELIASRNQQDTRLRALETHIKKKGGDVEAIVGVFTEAEEEKKPAPSKESVNMPEGLPSKEDLSRVKDIPPGFRK